MNYHACNQGPEEGLQSILARNGLEYLYITSSSAKLDGVDLKNDTYHHAMSAREPLNPFPNIPISLLYN